MKLFGNNFWSQHLLPGRYAAHVEKTILNVEYKKIENSEVNGISGSQDIARAINQLKDDLKAQDDRKKGLEDKLRAILFTIGIVISAMIFTLGNVPSRSNILGWISIVILVGGIIYLVSSAIRSVETLIPLPFHSAKSFVKFVNGNLIQYAEDTKENQLKEYLKSKLLNDNINLRIANKVYASFKLLRNGIILISCYFFVALFYKFSANEKNSVAAHAKFIVRINDSLTLTIPVNISTNFENFKIDLDSVEVSK
jgi:hypothetical protein